MDFRKCYHKHTDCFMNMGGYCKLLTGRVNSQECPFYNTQEQVDDERMKAHQRLVELGRGDLIEKFEYNSNRTW